MLLKNISLTESDLQIAMNRPDIHVPTAHGLHFNSQEITAGNAFFALKGTQHNGKEFLSDVKRRGAVFAVVDSLMPIDLPQVVVHDALETLIQLGKYRMHQNQAVKIAITGTNGKTTTKNWLTQILTNICTVAQVATTNKNLNTETGIAYAMTLFPETTKYAIFEMGTIKPGCIPAESRLVSPDIALLTNISKAHLNGFSSFRNYIKEKLSLFESPTLTHAVIPSMDPHYTEVLNCIKKQGIVPITYGIQEKDTIRLIKKLNNTLTVTIDKKMVTIPLAFMQQKWIYGVLGILGVLLALERQSNTQIIEKTISHFRNLHPLPGRGAWLTIPYHNGQIQIIDESYNANPESMNSSLYTLTHTQSKNRKVAILGDMLELGTESAYLHTQIKTKGVDMFISVGELSKKFSTHGKPHYHFDTVNQLISQFFTLILPSDIILIKGSNGIHLEKLIEYITQ